MSTTTETFTDRPVVVPADLPERLAAARVEAAELRPVLERIAGVLAEANALAVAMYPAEPEYDRAFDQWLVDCGAVALSDELDRISAAVVTAV